MQYKKHITTWTSYQTILRNTDFPERPNDLNADVKFLESTILEAHSQATDIKTIGPTPYRLPNNILHLIRQRRKIIKRHARTMSPADAAERNRLSHLIKSALKDRQNEAWQDKLVNLDADDGTLWTLSRTLRRNKTRKYPILRQGNRTAITESEKSELLAEILEKICDNNIPDSPEHLIIRQQLHVNKVKPGTPLLEVTLNELQGHIKIIKTKKAPGHEGIINLAIKFPT